MKLNWKKIFDWRIGDVNAPVVCTENGTIVGYQVRVGYIYHGYHTAKFYLPASCDMCLKLTPPELAARAYYEKMLRKMHAQRVR